MTVEAEAVAAEVAPGALVKVEGVEGTAEAGLEVAQQGVDQAELRQVAGGLTAGEDCLVVAVGRGYGAEATSLSGDDHQVVFLLVLVDELDLSQILIPLRGHRLLPPPWL